MHTPTSDAARPASPHRLRRFVTRRSGLVAGAAVLLTVGSTLVASAATSSTTFHGCVSRYGGVLYDVGTRTPSCRRHDTAISWNQTGPQGATGAAGPQGEPGPQGPAGPASSGTVLSTGVHQAVPFGVTTVLEANGITLEVSCNPANMTATLQARPTHDDGSFLYVYADSAAGGHVGSSVNLGTTPKTIETVPGTVGSQYVLEDRGSFNVASSNGHTLDGTYTLSAAGSCRFEASAIVG